MARPRTTSEAVHACFDEFELDEANARLLRGGLPLALAPTPFALLCEFVRRPQVLLEKGTLLDTVWGHQFVTESVLKTAISDLRTVLGDDSRQPRLIETVPRRGYRFIAQVRAPALAATHAVTATGSVSTPTTVAAPSAVAQGFIGRSEALARLVASWARVSAGDRQLVWVAGEPGIGKSSLIERFSALVSDGAQARGQCVDLYGAGEPYLPILESIAELCRSDTEAVTLLRTTAPSWLLQLPWLSTAEEREVLRRELAGAGPERMLREMGEWLDRYSGRQPLLLITEDLHWSDRGTLQLIDYIARRRTGSRLMWLASFRLAEVDALDHPLRQLRQELRLHGRCEEIVLDPFSESEVAEYLVDRAPALAADDAFVRALHVRSDGVPLFVASLVTDAIAEAPPTATPHGPRAPTLRRSNTDAAALAVPENLVGLIDQYIAKLGDEDKEVLTAAAACGTDFRTPTIARALERDLAWVDERCDALARAHLWLTAGSRPGAAASYAFRHTLFRQVLYERTRVSVRQDMHRRVGRALEAERREGTLVSAAELATHFARCRESLLALRYYAEAAETALLNLSPAECMDLTGQGLALVADAVSGTERSALEFELSGMHSLSAFHVLGVGDDTERSAARAYALLEQVPRHPLRGLLVHHHGFVQCLRAQYAEASAVADRAARSADGEDVALRLAAAALHGQLGLLLGQPANALQWLESHAPARDAVDCAPEHSFMQVSLLCMLSIHLLHVGRITESWNRLDHAYARAKKYGYPTGRMMVLWTNALMAIRIDDASRVDELAEELRELVEAYDLGQGQGAWRWFSGWALMHKGAAVEGLALIRAGYEHNLKLGMVAGSTETLGYAAEARLLAGDIDGAQFELGVALQRVGETGERVFLTQLLFLQASIASMRGDRALAKASLQASIEEAKAQQSPLLELRALIQLATEGAGSTDLRAIKACVDALHGGERLPLVARARSLLAASDTTAPSSSP